MAASKSPHQGFSLAPKAWRNPAGSVYRSTQACWAGGMEEEEDDEKEGGDRRVGGSGEDEDDDDDEKGASPTEANAA